MANKLSVFGCAVGMLLAIALSGCGGRGPAAFYMLDAVPAPAPSGGPGFPAGKTLGLGPVHLPEYLNRPQMVFATGPNSYRLDEDHRWAERLDEDVARSLTRQLAAELGITVQRFPWSQRQAPEYQVTVDVLWFHQEVDGYSRLEAQWRVRRQDRDVLARPFACAQAAAADAEAVVRAQSACLARLGQDIAAGLRELAAAGG